MLRDIIDFLKFIVAIVVIFGFVGALFFGGIAIFEAQQCKAYAASKGATSSYDWMMCYITKDGKTLTYGEYVASEVGTKVKAEIEQ